MYIANSQYYSVYIYIYIYKRIRLRESADYVLSQVKPSDLTIIEVYCTYAVYTSSCNSYICYIMIKLLLTHKTMSESKLL